MGKGTPSSSDDVEKGPEEKVRDRKSRPRLPPPQICPPPQKPWFPWLVPLIFMANLIMFFVTMYYNNCPAREDHPDCVLPFLKRFSFQPFKENVLLGPSALTLEKMGALERKLVVEEGEGWRLMSCMWLHAGVVHLLVNMMSLLFIGIRLEQEFGFMRIGLLYILSGLAGSLASSNHLKESKVSVGASGALFGLLGAMLSELFTNWTIYTNKCMALLILVVVIGLNLSLGFIPKVDNSAHIGGFLAGFFFGFVLLIRPQFGYVSRKYIPTSYNGQLKPRHKWYQYFLGSVATVFIILGYTYAFGHLYGVAPMKNLPFP